VASEFNSVLISGDADALWDYMGDAPGSVVVDWRAEEEEIVSDVAGQIIPGSLSCEWDDGRDLILIYKNRRRPVGLTFSPRDRYVCLRALNDVLSGEYELRVFRATLDSDTHIVFVKPALWWEDFDKQYPERSGAIFRRIDETVDFT
jgi:hypothetical protein